MADHSPAAGLTVSRRELIKRALMAGAAAVVPTGTLAHAGFGQSSLETGTLDTFETLTRAEAETLQAIVARLIPTDEHGPGARDARADHYIDQALGGALSASRQAYADGLASVDTYAQTSKGARFAALPPDGQDTVLREMEANTATGFSPDASTFFELLRTHTLEGTFCDPYYGGNADFVGWNLIGYPGIRLVVTPRHQRLDVAPRPVHRSAYDFGRFVKEVLNRGR